MSEISRQEAVEFAGMDSPKDGEPCDHPGCLHHHSHPCEGCGRIGGRTPLSLNTTINIDGIYHRVNISNTGRITGNHSRFKFYYHQGYKIREEGDVPAKSLMHALEKVLRRVRHEKSGAS